jgi:hypothetical protein
MEASLEVTELCCKVFTMIYPTITFFRKILKIYQEFLLSVIHFFMLVENWTAARRLLVNILTSIEGSRVGLAIVQKA